MMKKKFLLILSCAALLFACSDDKVVELTPETPPTPEEPAKSVVVRGLVASINGLKNASYYPDVNNKVLVSWRMFPDDSKETGFDLYRKSGNGEEVKLNEEPIVNSTNFQDTGADRKTDNVYRLCAAGSTETLDTYTLTADRASAGLPYVSIPLRSGLGIIDSWDFRANDASIGDVDGDGQYEIILKRLAAKIDGSGDSGGDEDADNNGDTGNKDLGPYHNTLLEAYKIDGTCLWRVALGPNIVGGNTTSFAVEDFDGDGRAEVAVRTAEGTVFGDGAQIGDTNNDGKTDYRVAGTQYLPECPSFLSIIDGLTGAEKARTDYIPTGPNSADWGDNYWKRAGSIRIGVGHFTGTHPQILICRGIYGKSVLEAWDFKGGKLTRLWNFNTANPGYEDWKGQGNHSLCVGDVDGDGCDEVIYGGMCVDHDGKGLWNSKHGHGDAMMLGKFDPSRDGLQIWSCFEACPFGVGAALRDAKTGETIWDFKYKGDMGRCMVADIDPDSPGCEMWWYKGKVHSAKGDDLGYDAKSYNAGIWFSGSLNRQLYDRSTIDDPRNSKGRVFTVYRYNVTTINSTKSNPCFYADIWGDWREELIQVLSDYSELRIFTTWYPTEYKFPYLMSDHVYRMSALNQNIGYNMPTNLGYYLGSDLIKDRTEAAGK